MGDSYLAQQAFGCKPDALYPPASVSRSVVLSPLRRPRCLGAPAPCIVTFPCHVSIPFPAEKKTGHTLLVYHILRHLSTQNHLAQVNVSLRQPGHPAVCRSNAGFHIKRQNQRKHDQAITFSGFSSHGLHNIKVVPGSPPARSVMIVSSPSTICTAPVVFLPHSKRPVTGHTP